MKTLPTAAALESATISFGEDLLDNERVSFTFEEAEEVAEGIGYSTAEVVIRALKALGFSMDERKPLKYFRTIGSNPHDRWSGKGSCASHGGSGYEQITGFAGQEG
jgi:hypothetical protein